MVDILIKVLSDGYVTVEREGLSVKYPCRPLMIATYNPQEGEIREHLLDRFAIALSTDAFPLSIAERLEGVDNVLGFSGGTSVQNTEEADKKLQLAESEEQKLRTQVEIARGIMQNVNMTKSQIQYLCEEATRGGCEGQRAEIFATEIAKSSAALDGRTAVNAEDLQKAVILAILPRATIIPSELESGDMAPEPPPPSQQSELQPIMEPPPPTTTSEVKETDDAEETETESKSTEEDVESETEDSSEEDDADLPIPAEFIFGVKEVKLSPALLKFSRWTRKGRGKYR